MVAPRVGPLSSGFIRGKSSFTFKLDDNSPTEQGLGLELLPISIGSLTKLKFEHNSNEAQLLDGARVRVKIVFVVAIVVVVVVAVVLVDVHFMFAHDRNKYPPTASAFVVVDQENGRYSICDPLICLVANQGAESRTNYANSVAILPQPSNCQGSDLWARGGGRRDAM